MHRITIWTGLAGILICCVAAVGGFGPSSGEIGGLIASAVWAAARAETPADASEAHESIRIPRHPAPSPDGGEIAFSYQGDIWIVPVAGGEARRLTANPAYEAYPIWSPDGRWIAFSSDRAGNDDIYVLPVAGGELRRLTWNSYQDLPTGWTPDSRAVLFRSWRFVLNGDNPGMFCVSLEGGLPFTILPVGGHDAALSPDGRTLAFAQGGGPWWRRNYQGSARYRLWLAELEEPLGDSDANGRLQSSRKLSQVSMAGQTAANLTMQAVGALRTASRYLNLTELNAVTQDPDRQPTDFWAAWEEGAPDWSRPEFETGVNRAPAWLPGGEHLLYLSEDEGVCNLKIVSTRTGRRDWVTRLDRGRLRFPALSRNGRLAAFEYEDGIYTVRLPDALPPHEGGDWGARIAAPQRLEIRIPYDLKADPLEWVKVDSGAEEMKLSPDGKQIAFVCQGEVFAMKASEKEPFAYNISQSPARDGQIDWAPDSKSLVFVSEREGNPDIYIARSADEADPRLARAVHIEIEPLVRGDEEQSQPHHSPDGKRIAFVRGRGTLMVMDADGSNQQEVLRHPREIDFSWSPDSKWIVLAREDDDFNSDIWIVPAEGGGEPVNISRHPDIDSAPQWSPDGTMLAFASRREFLNQTDIWYVRLTREEEERSREERLDIFSGDKPDTAKAGSEANEEDEEEKKDGEEKKDEQDEKETVIVRIDFEDIHKRLHRLTTFPGEETRVLISKDGSELVFVAENDGKRDLWKVKWDGSEPERLTKGGQEPRAVQWNEKMDRLFYLKSGGKFASVPLSGGETKSYDFATEMEIDRRLQRALVFDEGWRILGREFYDGDFHGCDWQAMRDRYRPWALAASTYRDFQDVIRMMMGELNASHLGVWDGPGDPSARGDALALDTGELGVIFDARYDGPGLRVGHVVKGSPAERVTSLLAPGDVIREVNGVELAPGANIWMNLARAVGKRTVLGVDDPQGTRREVVVRPISGRDLRELVYAEQVEARRSFIASAGGGRVAYIHIQGMEEASLDLYERDLYAEANGKDALIIDVRDNGGGWTCDLMLTSLMAGDHATTIARDSGPGYPEDRRVLYAWVKPIVVLCDENSFSNAEIFAWAIRTLGRGPVVGQQTHGGVISTGGTTLLDGMFMRLPGRGWYSKLDGSNEEGTGCMPDIVVANLPGDLVRGVDRQLERALDAALEQIER